MIEILHGDNVVESRGLLNQIRSSATIDEIISLNGNNLDPTILTQAVSSVSLFNLNKIIIIENLFLSLNKKKKNIKNILNILDKSNKENNIYIWESSEIPKTQLDLLGKNTKSRLFKIPKTIFQFLDSLMPNNAKKNIELYTESLKTSVPEIIFALLVKRVRQLIMTKDNVDPGSLASWQIARLTKQAKLFTMEKLIGMYYELIDLEYSFKSGSQPFTFPELIKNYIMQI